MTFKIYDKVRLATREITRLAKACSASFSDAFGSNVRERA
jgi:hypothetical protein